MKNIEDVLNNSYNEKIEIPSKVEYRINYTLNNLGKPKNSKIYIKKISTIIASLILVLFSGWTVYAAFNGTINGESIFEWIGIKFSNKTYQQYKESINETILKNETNVTLESTLYDEGFTIIEFDVTLSKEDKEYLNIGEKVVPDDYIENDKYEPSITGTTIDGRNLTNKELKQKIAEDNKDRVIDNIWLSINNNIKIFEDGYIYIEAPHSNMNIILNDNKIFARHNTTQIVNKISDYEYKVYQIYFLTDEKIGDQEEFEITIKDLALGTNYTKVDGGQKNILIPGEFKVKLSKNKTKNDTDIIYPNIEPIKYNNSSQFVQNIMKTPMITMVKISAEIKNVNSYNIENYISPLSYNVIDENGVQIPSQKIETKKQLIYSNGKVEDWPIEDIFNNRYFSNANLLLEEYIIIENGNNSIKIEAYENNNEIGNFNLKFD